MGSSKKQTVGYRYYMGLHFGLCHGPVDRVQEVRAGDRLAWSGDVTGNQSVIIDSPELFGGDKKEGGLSGQLDIEMGGPTQGVNSYLASRIGAAIPAFRGILSAIWRGGQVAANNPYIKPWAFRVERITAGWSTDVFQSTKAKIPVGLTGTPEIVLPRSVLAAAVAALNPGGKVEPYQFSGYDFDNSSSPTYESFFSEFGEGAVLDYVSYLSGAGPGDTGTQGAKTLAVDVTRGYLLYANNATWPGDVSSFTLEFLNAGGSVVAVVFSEGFITGIDRKHYLRYGASLGSFSTATLASGEASFTDGVITFESGKLVFTSAGGGSRNGSFEFACDALSIRQVRISNVRALCTRPTSTVGVSAVVLLQKTPKTIPAQQSIYSGMNPAHIVYECLTNTEWGMGYPTAAIDTDSFTLAGNALFDESFGLCMVWNRQDTIESFIRTVLDHCGGVLYVKPSDGKFALKLIRDDYDATTLPLFDPSNVIEVADYQRQAWGETVNEITIVYRDVDSNRDASVTVQDLANITTQGAVLSQTRQYPGIPSSFLAGRVAQRDLNAVATPLGKVRLRVNRAAWNLVPGDVFRLSWPDLGISQVVYRVIEVNRGTLQDGSISIEAAEDVFGLPDAVYVEEQLGEWQDPTTDPAPAPYRRMVEAPYWELARTLSAADLDYLDPLACYLQTVASRPSGDALNYEINARVGAADFEERAAGEFCPTATLSVPIGKTTTTIAFGEAENVDLVAPGGYALIGDEVVKVVGYDLAAGTATIARGILDTVPAEHAAGARIWFADAFAGVDQTEYAAAEVVDVKLLPRTGRGELPLADAPTDSITMAQRQHRPYPPGLFRINAQAYPAYLTDPATITVSWAHRDRLSQTAYLVEQGEGNIGPEAGTTYTLEVYDDDTDALIEDFTAIAGTSQAISVPTLTRRLRVELFSVRDGLDSWQRHVHAFDVAIGARMIEDGDDNRETDGGDARITE